MVIGTIVLAAVATFIIAQDLAVGWGEAELDAAMSDARANLEATGSVGWMTRMGSGLDILAMSPWIPLIGGAMIGAAPGGYQRTGLVVLIGAVIAATVLAFAVVVGLNGSDLVHADRLQHVKIPASLVASIEPGPSPMASAAGVALQLAIVSLCALVGYRFGTVLRRKPPPRGPRR